MAAEQPALTVLQLDTRFPRVPGDVACARTYRAPVEIIRIPRATVARVVTDRPDTIDLAPFDAAIARARGDVIVTSCGFLAPHQARLAARTGRPFIASALGALVELSETHGPRGILIATYDWGSLTAAHLAGYDCDIVGLPEDSHLRRVIAGDMATLDTARAGEEVAAAIRAHLRSHHRHILLECTNLPPYKAAIRAIADLPITDILTCIEAVRPGTVRPAFL
ncbi:hypothetical protein [Jannaschia donghaensis]|uniref:Asp/Glu/Hydantoin racemase n=1 Tax=Jannaschia donghaensis TaxID=420998 RepID=A0A0M6YPM8_9RHOB|nr:hypothetical protein [Jannaschia donghaensis]CTQ51207.1 hypothetical protein JDO7802_03246 [Jannaschia donghaensis]